MLVIGVSCIHPPSHEANCSDRRMSGYTAYSCSRHNIARHFPRPTDHRRGPPQSRIKATAPVRRKLAASQELFSGLLYCAGCGSKLHFATGKNMTPQQDCYRCSRYKSNTGDCTMHFIREETLKLFVLQRIFDVAALFFDDAMAFEEVAKSNTSKKPKKSLRNASVKSPKRKNALLNLTAFSSASMRMTSAGRSAMNGS